MFSTLKKAVIKVLAIYAVLMALMLIFASITSMNGAMNSAMAAGISEAVRTVPFDQTGEQTTLTLDQMTLGRQKFNSSCAQCHLDGGSKPNPDVDLSTQTLAQATPARDNIQSIVDYLDHPTTYDGLRSLEEFHPSTARPDIFPRMQDLNQADISAIAGYILTQPKIVGEQWAGGKPKR